VSEFEMCVRIAAAAGLGTVIGIEREYADKPAGLRTHLLVCMAAALVTTSSLLISDRLHVPGEALRVTAGVLTGIGFIGAGTIIHARGAVVGLTTAATIFMAAAIGIAAGGALYYLAVTAAVLTVFSTFVLRLFDARIGRHRAVADAKVRRSLDPARPAAARRAPERTG
jgi:putative Mg2+ transporter-C (MgtC) family protein